MSLETSKPGFPKQLFNKFGLAARRVGSAIEEKILGADWSEKPWPKQEPAPVKETHHDLIGGKPEEEAEDHEAPSVQFHPLAPPGYANPTVEQMMNAGYPQEAAEQIAHDIQAAGGLHVEAEGGTVKLTEGEMPPSDGHH